MSYKTELQGNNIDLQSILEMVDTLPEAEKLEDELSTQDNLIEQILTELDNKSSVPLPEISNPAGAEHILEGYQGISQDGSVIDGVYVPIEFTEEVVTASSDFKLIFSDAVLAKENWLIYTNSTGDSGSSQQITFVLAKNKEIIAGRYGTSGGTRGDMAGNSLGLNGSSVYYSTSQYGTRFTGSYTVKAW